MNKIILAKKFGVDIMEAKDFYTLIQIDHEIKEAYNRGELLGCDKEMLTRSLQHRIIVLKHKIKSVAEQLESRIEGIKTFDDLKAFTSDLYSSCRNKTITDEEFSSLHLKLCNHPGLNLMKVFEVEKPILKEHIKLLRQQIIYPQPNNLKQEVSNA